jgi:thymidine phosphorylase
MMHQPLDHGVGFEVRLRPGDPVSRGDVLGTVHARDEAGAELGVAALAGAVTIGAGGEPIVARPLVTARFGTRDASVEPAIPR